MTIFIIRTVFLIRTKL